MERTLQNFKSNYIEYVIEMNKKPRLFHINMLKKFIRRNQVQFLIIDNSDQLNLSQNLLKKKSLHCRYQLINYLKTKTSFNSTL